MAVRKDTTDGHTPTAEKPVALGGPVSQCPLGSAGPEDISTPAELTDDQKLIGQTAEEFVAKEVVPLIPDLELHKEGLMAQLLKKTGELGLLGGGVPEEYWAARASTAVSSANRGSRKRSPPTPLSA